MPPDDLGLVPDDLSLGALRRMHMDEPIEVTNPRAHAVSKALRAIEDGLGDLPSEQIHVHAALIQISATLALAQEVKNLRRMLEREGCRGD